MPESVISPNICTSCGLHTRKEHEGPRECIAALQRTAKLLVDKIGSPRPCSSCQATIYMVMVAETSGGGDRQKPRPKPYDISGQTHFLTCPNAADHFGPRK